MSGGAIRLERSRGGARADVWIDRPPVNVLDLAALGELAARVAEAPPARVLVLRGLSRAFSAGVSVADHVPEPRAIETMLSAMRVLLAALCDCRAATLAVVSGACLGGGAEIVAACDIVLVAEESRVGFPEIRLACFPPGAAALLPARIGGARAAEWILTGESVSGRQAAEAGFASRAVPASRLDAEADRLCERLLSASPRALAAALPLVRRSRREALSRDLPDAEDAYRSLAGSEDLARAVEIFEAQRQR